jgi:RNA polymerase sigma-70 factor (ECF subfamily)
MDVQEKKPELSRLLAVSQRPLYAFIRAQVRTPADADDVYQETATVLCDHFDAYDPEKPFFAWACGIAWRKVLSHRRNVARLKLVAGEELGAILSKSIAGAVARVDPRIDRLQECLGALKPESREMIEQHYYQEKEVRQIAGGIGVSERCIYKTLARIRRVLLDCIERKLAEER